MSRPRTFLRLASPNERRTISREDVGYYNALVIAAVYEVASENVDLTSARSFISPLKHCIREHSYLSVVVKDKHTEKPAYEGVSSINLEDHVSIIDEVNSAEEAEAFEKVLPPILDRPWPADIPPWRIIVLPLASHGSTVKRCFVVFSFSHTLGDGMVGITFHRTLLEALRRTTSTDEKESFLITPPTQVLPAAFDTPERLPISWKFLLGPLLPLYLPNSINEILGLRAAASTVDAGTWTGPPIFFDPAVAQQSRVRILEIEAPLVLRALQASRAHDSKLTASMHQLIVQALSKAIPDRDVTNFVSATAVDMRASIGISRYTWGLFVSGHYEVHPRVLETPFSDEMWAAASSITKRLAECGTRLHDQAIGLLRYVPSIRNWTLGKVGHRRDCSFEVSNLLAFDGGVHPTCNISKMVFSQPANVMSAPLVFNIISVQGSSLMCTVSWQAGGLGVPMEQERSFVDEIVSSLRAGFEALSD